MLLVMTVLIGVYTVGVTLVAQMGMGHRADGSHLIVDGASVGSELVGQQFTADDLFHSRPSAVEYDPQISGGSNLGPNHPDLLTAIRVRTAEYRVTNGLDPEALVPVDAVTTSASGLDPHISVANARLQAPRVAAAHGLPLAIVLDLIDAHTAKPALVFIGEPGVNVLKLNLAVMDAGG
jgi:K+-transporting ATPase ATPase C chain